MEIDIFRPGRVMKYCACEIQAAHNYGKVSQVLLTVLEKKVMSHDGVNMFMFIGKLL